MQSISATVTGTDVLQTLHVQAVSRPLQIVPDEPPETAVATVSANVSATFTATASP